MNYKINVTDSVNMDVFSLNITLNSLLYFPFCFLFVAILLQIVTNCKVSVENTLCTRLLHNVERSPVKRASRSALKGEVNRDTLRLRSNSDSFRLK